MTAKQEKLISEIEKLIDKLKKIINDGKQEVGDVEISNLQEEQKEKQENLEPLFDELLDKIKELPLETNITIPEENNSDQLIDENSEHLDSTKIAVNLAEILSLVRVSNRKDEINKELHEELLSYKSGLRREILSSVLKNIIHLHGKVIDQYNFYNKKQSEENANLVTDFPVLLKEYKNLADGLENLLYDYDIEVEIPNVGEEFNPRTQKQVRSIPTDNTEMERKIAECINAGFRDIATYRLLKQPEVAVFQIKTEF